jgi:hypothetical protein
MPTLLKTVSFQGFIKNIYALNQPTLLQQLIDLGFAF